MNYEFSFVSFVYFNYRIKNQKRDDNEKTNKNMKKIIEKNSHVCATSVNENENEN